MTTTAWVRANPEKKRAQNIRHYYKNHEANKKKSRERYHADLIANRIRSRQLRFKQRYGITEAQRAALFKRQGRCCAICKRRKPTIETWSGWHLDHCHETNEVRGVLCRRCNMGLGLFRHNKIFLRAAAKYLGQATAVKPKLALEENPDG